MIPHGACSKPCLRLHPESSVSCHPVQERSHSGPGCNTEKRNEQRDRLLAPVTWSGSLCFLSKRAWTKFQPAADACESEKCVAHDEGPGRCFVIQQLLQPV